MGAVHSRRATRALTKMAEADPALAALALWCAHRDRDGGEAPAATDGRTIYYAEGFEALTLPEQVGVCAHHVLHVAFRHPARARAMAGRFGTHFAPEVYNIAADALINETLQLAGHALPRPSVLVSDLARHLKEPPATPGEALARLDADLLYTLLMTAPHGGGADRSAEAAADRAASVEKTAAEAGYREDLEDAPDARDGASDSEDAAEWQQRLARAMEAGRQAGRGIGALGFRLGDIPEPSIPWEVHLRGLLAKAVTPDARHDWRRPARRWLAMEADARRMRGPMPAFEPSIVRERRIPRIAACIDTSSSIAATRLARFAAEIAGIGRRTGAEVHVLVFDDTVHARTTLGPGRWEAEILQIAFGRDGGTSFVEVLDEAQRLDPAMIVVLTDLDGPVGARPTADVLWCVPQPLPVRAPFGRVISLAR